jgi:transposase
MPMASTDGAFIQWLTQAGIAVERLTASQVAVLQAAFHFRQQVGTDYYSTRLLSHVLLHCGSGLAVAQIARLLEISRPTASRQQGLSSKATIQQARHRMDGRPHGKLLPRFAGPIVEFLCRHPEATRADLLDFIDHTLGVRVSRIALYKFLKKYGLDRVGTAAPAPVPAPVAVAAAQASAAPPDPPPVQPISTPAVAPAPPFCADARSSRARF